MTDALRRALNAARVEAQRLGVGYVGTEHLLLGLLTDQDSSTLRLLTSAGVSTLELRDEVEQRVERGSPPSNDSDLPYTSRSKAALECMIDEVRRLRAQQADTDHLLLGLAAEERGIAAEALSARGLGIARLRTLVGPPRPSPFDGLRRWFRRRSTSDQGPPGA